MASDPTVACIMLTRDRHELARRAVECFRASSYDPVKRMLLILDSGDPGWYDHRSDAENEAHLGNEAHAHRSIGTLRNMANACVQSDVILHWDSDDHSHPSRIAEQVALLQSSGAEAVGYREALFWNERRCQIRVDPSQPGPDGEGCLGIVESVGEAWLYSSPSPRYIIGGTLCYWRSTWERRPFPDLPKRNAAGQMGSGEDVMWQREVQCVGVTSFGHFIDTSDPDWLRKLSMCYTETDRDKVCEPRFVGRIHGANTMPYNIEAHPDSWRRVPQWDERLRGVMA